MSGGSSPTSSRNSVPPAASSKRPRRRCEAPVKAPRSCPNSSEAMRAAGIAAQLTLTNGRAARRDRRWMARATSSLPVPVSPLISTVESVGATLLTSARAACRAGEVPTRSSNTAGVSASSRNATLSPMSPVGHGGMSAGRPLMRPICPVVRPIISTAANVIVLSSSSRGLRDDLLHDVQQGVSIHGLAQERDRTRLQRTALLRLARAAGQEDDRDVRAALSQAALQLETVDPRHPHVEDETPGDRRTSRSEKGLGRVERLGLEAEGMDQPACRLTHRDVVVHDRDETLVSACHTAHCAPFANLYPWPERSDRRRGSSSCSLGQGFLLSLGTGPPPSALGGDAELGRHPDERGERLGAHLLHDVGAVELDRPLGRGEVAVDLLVEEPGDDRRQDLALARGELLVALPQGARLVALGM